MNNKSQTFSADEKDEEVFEVKDTLKPLSPKTTDLVVMKPRALTMSLVPRPNMKHEGAAMSSELPTVLSEAVSRNSGSSLQIKESHSRSTNDEDKKVSAVQKTLKPSSPKTTTHHVVISPNIQNTHDEVAGIRSELPRYSGSSFLINESHTYTTNNEDKKVSAVQKTLKP